jgi:predicted GNAT family acetyltransferase
MTQTFHSEDAVDVVVTNNAAAQRYEAHVDGELAGLTTYVAVGDRVVFTHAEVDARWEHKGVGSALARGALDDVVAHGKLITPKCPFIVSYVLSHPSYLEHVDARHRGELEARAGRPTDREGK